MNYIDNYSWRCLLGKQSKNILEHNQIYQWSVGARQNACVNRPLIVQDLVWLQSGINIHYLSEENCQFLMNQKIKIKKTKMTSTTIDLTQLNLSGNANKSLRHAINRAGKYNLTQEDNFRSINDVKVLLEEWSNVLAQKYFRDNSGKNFFFYQNNWHQDCHNVFLYDGNDLVAFGTAAPCNNGNSSYIIGKALCHKYYGLSEYTDYLLYIKCLKHNINCIDLGQTTKGLIHYKGKFPGASQYPYYDVKVI